VVAAATKRRGLHDPAPPADIPGVARRRRTSRWTATLAAPGIGRGVLRAGLLSGLLSGLVAGSVTGSVGASASAAAAQPPIRAGDPRTSAAARAEAARAAAKVAELTAEYRRRQAAATRAAEALAAAFSVAGSAESASSDAESQIRIARAHQAARVRALYVEGSGGFTLAVLDADSVQDALWRLNVGRRVGAAVVRAAGDDLARSQDAAVLAAERSAAADAAGTDLAQALARLQEESGGAHRILTEAERRLETLSTQARRLKAVEDAAAALAAARAAASAGLSGGGPVGALGIPQEYERAYRAAGGACSGLRWTLLAAVGQVESGHGRTNGPSSAGAVGPMQFLPATFAGYAVDGNGDGRTDPWDPADAIPTAARYLCASGVDGTAAGDQRALLAYNHAQWYVDLVLRTEQAIVAKEQSTAAADPAQDPLSPAPPAP